MLAQILIRLGDAWVVLVGRKVATTPLEMPMHIAITYSVSEGKAPKDVVELVLKELQRVSRCAPPS